MDGAELECFKAISPSGGTEVTGVTEVAGE